ncbi:MAG TPA: tetratricopeptide repeat protein [Oculatellaceae cyanobacterium]
MKRFTSVLFLASILLSLSPSYASEYEPDYKDSDDGVVTSIEAVENSTNSSGVLARKAEYCMKNGNYDRAVKLAQQALEIKNDTDLHQLYAETLEKKFRNQKTKDPGLYMKSVEEWLKAFRQEGGEENLSFHGISLPGEQMWWRDEDRTLIARQHIQTLTGHLPRPWETNQRFLNRVQKEMKGTVEGKVLPPKPTDTAQLLAIPKSTAAVKL